MYFPSRYWFQIACGGGNANCNGNGQGGTSYSTQLYTQGYMSGQNSIRPILCNSILAVMLFISNT